MSLLLQENFRKFGTVSTGKFNFMLNFDFSIAAFLHEESPTALPADSIREGKKAAH